MNLHNAYDDINDRDQGFDLNFALRNDPSINALASVPEVMQTPQRNAQSSVRVKAQTRS